MDGESEGSSAAAQGALEHDPDRSAQRGFLSRILGAFGQGETGETGETPAEGNTEGQPAQALLPGIANLRRMRVDDVVIPAVEIVAVPDTACHRVTPPQRAWPAERRSPSSGDRHLPPDPESRDRG